MTVVGAFNVRGGTAGTVTAEHRPAGRSRSASRNMGPGFRRGDDSASINPSSVYPANDSAARTPDASASDTRRLYITVAERTA